MLLTKKAFVEKLLMEERVRVSEKDKKAVRDVAKEVFHASLSAEDEDSMMNSFQRHARNTIAELEKLEFHYKQYDYPGKSILAMGKQLMQSVLQVSSALEFFGTISKKRDDFYDFAEDYEPVKSFFSGEQQQIFKRTLDMLAIYDDSKTYIVDAELEFIVAQMRTIVRQEKPYGNIPKLPSLREKFMTAYTKILEEEEAPVLDSIDQSRSYTADDFVLAFMIQTYTCTIHGKCQISAFKETCHQPVNVIFHKSIRRFHKTVFYRLHGGLHVIAGIHRDKCLNIIQRVDIALCSALQSKSNAQSALPQRRIPFCRQLRHRGRRSCHK